MSARITNQIHEKLIERCNLLGCSMNEYLNGAIELGLNGSTQQDLGIDLDVSDEEESRLDNQTPKLNLSVEYGKITDAEGNLIGYVKGFSQSDLNQNGTGKVVSGICQSHSERTG
ncbi:MAG: hypothetical protein EB170_08755 [Nitrosopumilaceae archaeon]|nr:hypothetical protein [Nitrosopumilaceae archaeon]